MTVSCGNDTLPLVGWRTPANIFNSVLLPAPFLPIRAMRSEGLITKEMSEKRVVPENSTAILSIETIIIIYVR